MAFYSIELDSVMIEIGNGGIQVCVVEGKIPDKANITAVTFKPLKTPQEVGTEVEGENESGEKGFGFLINNLEGLGVLERALAMCRKKMTPSEAK